MQNIPIVKDNGHQFGFLYKSITKKKKKKEPSWAINGLVNLKIEELVFTTIHNSCQLNTDWIWNNDWLSTQPEKLWIWFSPLKLMSGIWG